MSCSRPLDGSEAWTARAEGDRAAAGLRVPRPSTALALALAAVVLATGCGKKGDPEPPLRQIPRAATDLTALQRGDEVILHFTYPQVTTAGRPLPALDRVEVWEVVRAMPPMPAPEAPPEPSAPEAGEEAPAAESASTDQATSAAPSRAAEAPSPPSPSAAPRPQLSPLDARELAGAAVLRLSLAGAEVAAATIGDRIVLHLPLPTPHPAEPQVHYFAVRTATARELSAYSNQAVQPTRPPPAAASGITAVARADGVEVGWAGAAAGVVGHQVYRRDAEAREFGDPLAFVAAGTPSSHLDAGASYGRRYIYAVTAVAERAPLIESAIAATREVDYRDRFPPPPPAGLVALADPAQVRLVWDASEAADLAGYRVSRRRDGGAWEVLTAEPLSALSYVDAGLTAGERVAYRVTAVDQLGNESEPSETAATLP